MFKLIGTAFRLVILAILVIIALIIFTPNLVKGAGNAILNSLNSSSAQGIAQIIPHSQGSGADLQVQLSGLTANSNYYVTLDQGQCGGATLYTIGKVSSDSNGSSTALLSFNNLGNALTQGLWLDVHQGGNANGQSVACGQVLNLDAVLGITPTVTVAPTAIPTTPPTTGTPTPTSSITGTTNSTDNTDRNPPLVGGRGFTSNGFPNTGVAPASSNSYDNATFPRKY